MNISYFRQQRCSKPIQNIAFLKTHYTGSDVITNILNRYGDLNNLNIALPSDGLSTFFWPMRFQWKYIDITLLNGSLPNIISNHARYNNDVMDNILNPGSVYVTILRDPVTQLESTFNNLEFGKLLEVRNTTDQIYTFLQDPKFYIQGVIKRKRFKVSKWARRYYNRTWFHEYIIIVSIFFFYLFKVYGGYESERKSLKQYSPVKRRTSRRYFNYCIP